MIEVRGLTKRYGQRLAVDDVSFRVEPGVVTGFLGPNGAGKSTTMRLILGLDRPDGGTATVNGRPYQSLSAPLLQVGALLDAKAVHRGRSARAHLRSLAVTHSIPNSRVDEVIHLTGLDTVADRRAGGFSLGMGQRLGIAVALLGDPHTLILDEPVNGLDPDGVIWVRELLRYEASRGKAVLVSSHLMSEMALTADRVIVIARGHVVADAALTDLISGAGGEHVRVRSPRLAELTAGLQAQGGRIQTIPEADAPAADVYGLSAERIGNFAAEIGVPLHELRPIEVSLEQAYLQLTHDQTEYVAGGTR